MKAPLFRIFIPKTRRPLSCVAGFALEYIQLEGTSPDSEPYFEIYHLNQKLDHNMTRTPALQSQTSLGSGRNWLQVFWVWECPRSLQQSLYSICTTIASSKQGHDAYIVLGNVLMPVSRTIMQRRYANRMIKSKSAGSSSVSLLVISEGSFVFKLQRTPPSSRQPEETSLVLN